MSGGFDEKFCIKSIQVALFFVPDTNFKPISFAGNVSNKMSGLFPDDPNIISLPPNVPLEIPRVMFTNANQESLNAGINRADLALNITSLDEIDRSVLPNVILLNSIINEDMRIAVQRVGVVATYNILQPNVKEISDRYFKDGKIDGSDGCNFAWHKSFQLNGLETNLWVRYTLSDFYGAVNSLIIDVNSFQNISLMGRNVTEITGQYISYIRSDLQNVLKW